MATLSTTQEYHTPRHKIDPSSPFDEGLHPYAGAKGGWHRPMAACRVRASAPPRGGWGVSSPWRLKKKSPGRRGARLPHRAWVAAGSAQSRASHNPIAATDTSYWFKVSNGGRTEPGRQYDAGTSRFHGLTCLRGSRRDRHCKAGSVWSKCTKQSICAPVCLCAQGGNAPGPRAITS